MAIDKSNVARSFSRAAVSYDSVAYLQRDIGEILLAKLQKEFSSWAEFNLNSVPELNSSAMQDEFSCELNSSVALPPH